MAAPNDIEKSHHYLWRFWSEFPKAGHVAIYDRSWYGRVLVERVEGFCKEWEWKQAYREINEMEENFSNFGAVMVKFWIHIDPRMNNSNDSKHGNLILPSVGNWEMRTGETGKNGSLTKERPMICFSVPIPPMPPGPSLKVIANVSLASVPLIP